MNLLENFYYCYRIKPYFSQKIKALKKEPKLFLWDILEIDNFSIKFENFIGNHLLKYVHYLKDYYGLDVSLNYIRDRDKREVDFLITLKNKPLIAIEVKENDEKISKNLKYFKKKLSIPFNYQVLAKENVDFVSSDIRVISADKFLSVLV